MTQHLKDSKVYVGIWMHSFSVFSVGLILQPVEKQMGAQKCGDGKQGG